MRHLSAAILAAAFAVGSVSVALADCPGHAKQTATIASADQSTPSTPIRTPAPTSQSGS